MIHEQSARSKMIQIILRDDSWNNLIGAEGRVSSAFRMEVLLHWLGNVGLGVKELVSVEAVVELGVFVDFFVFFSKER